MFLVLRQGRLKANQGFDEFNNRAFQTRTLDEIPNSAGLEKEREANRERKREGYGFLRKDVCCLMPGVLNRIRFLPSLHPPS